MAIKDHDKHYDDLAGAVPGQPNQVSRHLKLGERSLNQVVYQSGKPVLDAELNLSQDISEYTRQLLARREAQSGWLKGQTFRDGYLDFTFQHSCDEGFAPNTFSMKKMVALVAGNPVVVEYTDTSVGGGNTITLPAPTTYDGTNATIKRTDFVFLEVWKTLVAPSPRAWATVTIHECGTPPLLEVGVDEVAITVPVSAGGSGLQTHFVVAAEGTGYPSIPDSTNWEIGANGCSTADYLAHAINNAVIGVTAYTNGTEVITLKANLQGASGNTISIEVVSTEATEIVIPGGLFTGGEDRPNKPAQNKIWRHGNVQSPEVTWLEDDLADPFIDTESTQRIQLQYRIRATGAGEGVNYKIHPDGFTTPRNIPGGEGQTNAQGALSVPVDEYPFVPADRESVRDNSDAVAYGIQDDGLFVAGDGSEEAAAALGAVDGFVYAIPIGFVFRRNDIWNAPEAFKGFDPRNNANGAPTHDHGGYNGPLGVIPAGHSDRPDALFSDCIDANDILDLRRHVAMAGHDLKAELQYQIQSLLDGEFRTWAIDSSDKDTLGGSSGNVSTRFLVCNEIGREQGKGGNPPHSGDTQRGTTIRSFDHIARRFGDQAVVERMTFAFWPGDRAASGAVPDGIPGQLNDGKYVSKTGNGNRWSEDDVLHLNLGSFDASTLGGVFSGGAWANSFPDGPYVTQFAPPGMVITDVWLVHHDDGHYDATEPVDQRVQIKHIDGLGTAHVELHLDANDDTVSGGLPVILNSNDEYKLVRSAGDDLALLAGSPRRIFVEVEVSYPIGYGLTDTPDEKVEPDPEVYPFGEIIQCGGVPPTDMEHPLPPQWRPGYREVKLEYVAGHNGGGAPIGSVPGHEEQIVSTTQNQLRLPRRVYRSGSHLLTVSDVPATAPVGVNDDQSAYGSSERVISLANLLSGTQTLCQVTYFAQDPLPNWGGAGTGYQIAAYFRSNAPQTCGVKEGDINGPLAGGQLPSKLEVEPLIMADNLWTGQVGMGSVDSSFPYIAPLDQIPINDGSGLSGEVGGDEAWVAGQTHEWYFCATAQTSVDDFDATTGLLSLHPFVPADRTQLLRLGGDENEQKPRKDMEFRAYYPFADDSTYRPTIMSQPLSGAVRHKVFIPMLVRATEDAKGAAGGILYRRNEMLLIVLSRFAALDTDNTVVFTDDGNTTCAAVYRTKNLLLTVGD
jgi:hypothetical protein